MDLGQRLRDARLEAGLSQRQLCGDTITRNMLSQIESGKAQPSMPTLRILAQRLGKSVAYFLEEAQQEPPVMARARESFAAGLYRQALTLLEEAQDSEERRLLQALCDMELAQQAIDDGRLPYARELLEKAGTGRSLYWTAPMERQRLLLLWQAGKAVTLAPDDRELLLRAEEALREEKGAQAARYLDAAENRDEGWCVLRGKAALAMQQYEEAASLFHKAEHARPEQTAPLLEQCYRELEDYKKAYFYACKQKL